LIFISDFSYQVNKKDYYVLSFFLCWPQLNDVLYAASKGLKPRQTNKKHFQVIDLDLRLAFKG
jgi:hypothetical protein